MPQQCYETRNMRLETSLVIRQGVSQECLIFGIAHQYIKIGNYRAM